MEYFATIPTTTSVVGHPVVTVSATDRDSTLDDGTGFGDVTYHILSGNEDKLFAFDNKTGKSLLRICIEFSYVQKTLKNRVINPRGPLARVIARLLTTPSD